MSIARFEARVNSKECIARNSNLTCPGTRWLRASIALNLKKKIAEEMVPEVTRSNCTQGVFFLNTPARDSQPSQPHARAYILMYRDWGERVPWCTGIYSCISKTILGAFAHVWPPHDGQGNGRLVVCVVRGLGGVRY